MIGDRSESTQGRSVTDMLGRNIEPINPSLGFNALNVRGQASSAGAPDTGNIDLEGTISGIMGSPGRGLQVSTCQQCSFKFARNNAFDYKLVIGGYNGATGTCSGSNIGVPGVFYDGIGGESIGPGNAGGTTQNDYTTCIDPAAVSPVQYPPRASSPSMLP